MLQIGIFFILTLLTLMQINFLALNLPFFAIFSFFLFSSRDFSFWWLLFVSLLLALLANLNFGVVLIAFTLTFFTLDFVSRLVPDNRLVKGILLVAALVLSEYSLLTVGRILQ
jgi:hypothetical protein